MEDQGARLVRIFSGIVVQFEDLEKRHDVITHRDFLGNFGGDVQRGVGKKNSLAIGEVAQRIKALTGRAIETVNDVAVVFR